MTLGNRGDLAAIASAHRPIRIHWQRFAAEAGRFLDPDRPTQAAKPTRVDM